MGIFFKGIKKEKSVASGVKLCGACNDCEHTEKMKTARFMKKDLYVPRVKSARVFGKKKGGE